MTTDQLKNLRDAIDAHLEGRPVQCRYLGCLEEYAWVDAKSPFLSNQSEWRPKPTEPRRGWALIYADRNGYIYKDRETAEKMALHHDPFPDIVEFIEVIK